MLVGGQPASGNRAVPFPEVLSLLGLSVQLGLAILKKKPRDLTSTYMLLCPWEHVLYLASEMSHRAAAQHLMGLCPEVNRKACWAWTVRGAAGSSLASSHSS